MVVVMKFCKTPISSILNSFLGKKSPISHFKVCNLHIWQIIFKLAIFWRYVIVFIQSLPDFSVEGGRKCWITLYVLATTKEHLNEWVTVKVNVKDHFKKFHNLDLDEINGVAIMADTDNSKLSSVAYYQNIYFSAE